MKYFKYVFVTLLVISMMIVAFGCGSSSSSTDATLSPEENDSILMSYRQDAASIRESMEESMGHPMFNSNDDEGDSDY